MSVTKAEFQRLFARHSLPNEDDLKHLRACKTTLVKLPVGEHTFHSWECDGGDEGKGVSIRDALALSLTSPYWWSPLFFDGKWWSPYVKPAPWMEDEFVLIDPHAWVDYVGRSQKVDSHLPSAHPRRGIRALLQNIFFTPGYPLDVEKCKSVEIQLEAILTKLEGNEDWVTWEAVEMAFIAGMSYPMKLQSFRTNAEDLKKGRKLIENQLSARGARLEWTKAASEFLVGRINATARDVAEHLRDQCICDFKVWGDDIDFLGAKPHTKTRGAFETAVSTLKKNLREKS